MVYKGGKHIPILKDKGKWAKGTTSGDAHEVLNKRKPEHRKFLKLVKRYDQARNRQEELSDLGYDAFSPYLGNTGFRQPKYDDYYDNFDRYQSRNNSADNVHRTMRKLKSQIIKERKRLNISYKMLWK